MDLIKGWQIDASKVSDREAAEAARREAEQREKARQERIERGRTDPEFFVNYYLSHYFKHPATGQPSGLGEWQREIIEDTREKGMFAYAAPRGHGKTTFISFGLTLRDLIYGFSKFSVYIGPNAAAAEERLGEISTELEINERIIEDFGELLSSWTPGTAKAKGKVKTKKTAKDLILSNGARILGRGAAGNIRGIRNRENRPDRLILDDVDKDDEARSPERIEKRIKWFKKVVIPLQGAAGVTILVVGNIIAPKTLLTDCLASKSFTSRVYRAIQDDGNPLMPHIWPIERLREMREALGSDVFETEFQNNPPSEGTRPFKEQWLNKRWTPEMLAQADPGIVLALDLSKGKNERSDYQAFVAIRRDAVGNIFILKVDLGRRTRKELVARSFELADILHVKSIVSFVVETNGFQEWFSEELNETSRERGYDLPIVQQTNTLDKYSRVVKLSPIAEGGRLYFPPEGDVAFDENIKLLIRQMKEFPEGKHDDGPDALAMAVEESGRMRRNQSAQIIPWSPFDREGGPTNLDYLRGKP